MAGIYVHIPLCKQRCYYCDFYSTRLLHRADAYVGAILSECEMRMAELQGEQVRTLYVGGGTPSVLPLSLLRRLAQGLVAVAGKDALEEFTIEVNPDDVTPELAESLVAVGVNRVSMGVQSFVDDELRAVNRRHTAAQAVEAVKTLRANGIANVSIDLIYGLPRQTLGTLECSIDAALALGMQHLSAYNLSYELGTPLWQMREQGRVKEAPDELCVAMYEMLCRRFRSAGYEHYEISNFTLPGFRSRHNSAYWDATPYLGLGAAAHSYDGRVRRYNPADLECYVAMIAAKELPCQIEEETEENQVNDVIMTRLRTSDGLNVERLASVFGTEVATQVMRAAAPHVVAGRLILKNNVLRLTEQSVMLSDAIISDLFI